jgi:hypothetical protein
LKLQQDHKIHTQNTKIQETIRENTQNPVEKPSKQKLGRCKKNQHLEVTKTKSFSQPGFFGAKLSS